MATITLSTDDLTGETLPDNNLPTTIRVNDERGDISITLDLSDTSWKKLQKALEPFVSKGRAITLPTTRKPATDSTEAAEARAWAIANRPDLNVKDRGAVPTAALDAYREWKASQENGTAIETVTEVN